MVSILVFRSWVVDRVTFLKGFDREGQTRAAFHTDSGTPRSGPDPNVSSHTCCYHPPPEKRDMPCGCHKADSRNLIVCIDGTANQFGDKVCDGVV